MEKERKTYTDALTRLAKGTDAGLYRLVPERVEIVNSDETLIQVLQECRETKKPVTFKAGGTSLSGQTITNSVLIEIGPDYGHAQILDEGQRVKLPCSITGEAANRLLQPYGRKLGPQPASIKSAKIGGIVANNSSGSSYGITYNSYHTIESMRFILADGTTVDTASAESRQAFSQSHASLLSELRRLREEILSDDKVRERIRHKFELKNTCGYGMNSFLDHEDPIDILAHLMIGSEGTLGFISEVVFKTVPNDPLKASALIYFPDLKEACKAIGPLRQCSKVSAAELMDRNALRTVQEEPGMPEELKSLPDEAVALLIDTSSDTPEALTLQFQEIEQKLQDVHTLYPVSFTTDPHLYATYWRVRNGLFTSAAGSRPRGTVAIIEDIAFREAVLGDALTQVRETLCRYHYDNFVMWGHLLDGNVHFTIFPDINHQAGIDNYAAFMRELVDDVLAFDGSLKAEHGTGRNMAPFVEREWGSEIYQLMWRVKRAVDPDNLLNPGVLLNEDPEVFLKDLKRIPLANDRIDKCIECGFCEVQCPARNLTLTPRQRVVIYRKLADLAANGGSNSPLYRELKDAFDYKGNKTCATDGLCATACPVGINTGLLIKELRWKENSATANRIASFIANHMAGTTATLRPLLHLPHLLSKVVGYDNFERLTRFLFEASGHRFPLWTRYTPSGAKRPKPLPTQVTASGFEMVYFPACITRTMGISADYNKSDEAIDVTHKTEALLRKAGCVIHYPEAMDRLCCGMAFSSKGFRQQAAQKEKELNEALLKASDNGRLPILCDMSPCLLHMRETLDPRLHLYEPVEFIYKFLRDRLIFEPLPITVAVHSTCSTTKMGVKDKLKALAGLCAERVVSPEEVTCCGWAGDRGFFFPELNASALRALKPNLKGATEGYSNSRTCEIGLSMNSGISYKSIVYLVDKATRAK